MAILIPEAPKNSPLSERLVFEKLGRDLGDECVILHSLGLPGHETKIWGEADIVVLSTAGIFALEVKGGTVKCADGIWEYSSPGLKPFTKKEDPWTQAKGTMVAIRETLFAADHTFKQSLFGYGVVMPATQFTTTGAEIVPEVLLDKRHFPQTIDHYINRLRDYWEETCRKKHGRNYRGLTPAQIRQARQILRPNLETVLSIGSYLTGVGSKLLQLTNEQVRVSRRLGANPRTIVRGAAGTGKSVLAADRARQLSSEGAKVLYICFSQLLASHVRASFAAGGDVGVEVRHVHALYHDLITSAGLGDALRAEDDSRNDFFGQRFPLLASEALLALGDQGWDVLIIDEAQDLLTPEHLDVLDLLLRDGLRRGRWHIFLDKLQNLYDSDVQEQVELRLADSYPAFDDLTENCRNTRQVATQASIISGLELAISGAAEGLDCVNHWYRDKEDALARLEQLVADLLASDVKLSDMVILSTRRRENSLLAGVQRIAGRPVADASDQAGVRAGGLMFSTMHGFKGLERMVVIAIDMAEIGEDQYAMLHYAGLSRAQGLLHALIPSSVRPAFARQAALFGARLGGSAA